MIKTEEVGSTKWSKRNILRKKMSQKARVSRLWWKVDFISGLFRTNIATRLPNIPKMQVRGVKISLIQSLENVSKSSS